MGMSEATYFYVQRPGVIRTAQAALTGGGERQAEATGRRSQPGQSHAPGSSSKKSMAPGRRREVIQWLQERYRVNTPCLLSLDEAPELSFCLEEIRVRDQAPIFMRNQWRKIWEQAAEMTLGDEPDCAKLNISLRKQILPQTNSLKNKLYWQEVCSLVTVWVFDLVRLSDVGRCLVCAFREKLRLF